MTANATKRSIRNIMRRSNPIEKLNILTFPTHERYEENLCRTGHNFYSLTVLPGKEWDEDYAKVPENYTILHKIPNDIEFDLILAHSSCNRLQIAHDYLSSTQGATTNMCYVPILRHCHVLPDVRFDVNTQIQAYGSIPIGENSFISNYNMGAWNYNENNSSVVEHGVDTEFWKPNDNTSKDNACLSVVNDWPNRDWCCGFNLWRETTAGLPIKVFGKSPGLSEPAKSTEHLREIYQSSKIFYNTSLHSPVPSVLLEAMACGCAVVSTANCMIPEIIENGKNGLISNDPQELRGFLELLLKDEDLAKELGENARKTIVERYNLETFVDNWNNLFYSTVNNYRNK
tara:strand:+ start:5294 stop:6325 length:1032 start_codon:yes stop_codon:yes gene_type:complete